MTKAHTGFEDNGSIVQATSAGLAFLAPGEGEHITKTPRTACGRSDTEPLFGVKPWRGFLVA